MSKLTKQEKLQGRVRIISILLTTVLIISGVGLYNKNKDRKLEKKIVQAQAVAEAPESTKPSEPEQVPTQPVETPTAPIVDVVATNPNGCNQATQWIWADGSCHDKEVAQVSTPQPVVRSSGGCEELRGKLLALGVGEYEIDAAITLAQRESSCNEYARNSDGGACGYFQSLPCGKWGMPGSDTYLPGAIAYARGRYGNYNNALAHSYAFNWY